MAKQLNIDMSIRADTSQAKQAMMDLQKSLDTILSKRTITIDDTSINQAKQAAMDLKHHLVAATNINTGKLDLSKFSASLNKSGQSLQGLYNNLSQIGPEGQSAFLALSQSIAKADASAISLGSKLGGLMTTLKNTAKWQLSSSLLHGFMGAIQNAYGYAQDLNQSLNNIRIITGQNIDQMAQFAKEANNAAKALSTTTTDYTNASLIYYQQGLSDEEVKARTDTTIKLANISRQSAEEVSSQMTAIWNNFADGAENLEYYADVITKLGATTASSSDEIAQGLEKFAAVADTVGLSYEKASAALATVVAETRQSADVVGTAFRTLFARVEGLQLGKTLEDGVDLNKYSKALDTVGVKILDDNKQIKQMDTILDELGTKWDSIGKSEQIALAQTVAGVRQYTQFISLMDNYDKVQKNEDVAKSSTGTIQEQANIYAESWEAARDRVTAAAEEIYDQLLNDEAFIDILDGFEKFLEFISNIIDGLGGLKGILLLIGSIFMQQYAKEMPAFIEKMTTSIRILTGEEEKRRQVMLEENADIINKKMSNETRSQALNAEIAGTKIVSTMYSELARKRASLSQSEIASAEEKIKEIEARVRNAKAIGEEVDQLQKKEKELESEARLSISGKQGSYNKSISKYMDENDIEQTGERGQLIQKGADIAFQDSGRSEQIELEKNKLTELNAEYNKLEEEFIELAGKGASLTDEEKQRLDTVNEKLSNIGTSINKTEKKIQSLSSVTGKDIFKSFKTVNSDYAKLNNALERMNEKTKIWKDRLNEVGQDREGIQKITSEMQEYIKKVKEAGSNTQILENAIKDFSAGKIDIETLMNEFQEFYELNPELENLSDKFNTIKSSLIALGADSNKLDELAEKIRLGTINAEELEVEIKKIVAAGKTSFDHNVKFSEGLTKLGSSMMQVAMVIREIHNLGQIFSDEDLSPGEKLLQTMTSISMILPIITMLINKQKLSELSLAAAQVLHIARANGVTAAEWAAAAAKKGSAAATWTLIWPIGVLMLAIAGLVGVVWLIVKAFQAWQANSPEEKLKKEKAAAEELSKTYEDLKGKYDELKQSISDYKSSLNALESLTKGTQEWRDAVRETNAYALELIKTYKLLKGTDYTVDSNGVIKITSERMNKIVEEEEKNLITVQMGQLSQEERVRKREQNENAVSEDNATYNLEEKYSQEILDFMNSYKEDFSAGSISIDDLWELTKEQYLETNPNLENHLGDWEKQQWTTYLKKDQGITTEEEANNAQIAAMYTAQDKYVQSSQNKEALTNVAKKIYSNIEENLYEKQQGILSNDDYSGRKAAEEYLKKLGTKYDAGSVFIDGDKIKYTFLDENGEQKEGTQNVNAAAATLAAEEVQKDLSEKLQNLDKTITQLNANDGQALSNFATEHTFLNTTQNDINNLQKNFKDSTKKSIKEASAEEIQQYIADIFGNGDIEDTVSLLGFESAIAMSNAFIKGFDDFDKVWEDIVASGTDKLLPGIDKLSAEAAQKITKTFNDIRLGPAGEKAANSYIDGLNDMLGDLSGTKRTEALNRLGKIDWTNKGAMKEAKKILKEYGVSIDETSDKFKNFTKATQSIADLNTDFSTLDTNLTNISKALSKIKFGDIIDKEDYETLVAYNDEWERFFIMQTDGTRKFIGDANQMKKAIIEEFKEGKKRIEEEKKVQDAFKNDSKNNALDGNTWKAGATNIREGTEVEDFDPSNSYSFNMTDTAYEIAALKGYDKDRIEEIFQNYKDNLKIDINEDLSNIANETQKKAKEEAIEKAKDAREELARLYETIGGVISEDYLADLEQSNEKIASTATNLSELKKLYDDAGIGAEAYDKQLTVLAMSTQSLTELQSLHMAVLEEEGQIYGLDAEEYSRALLQLAGNYDNCTNEILKYQQALASGSAELVEHTQAVLENAISIGEQAKALGLEAEQVEEQAKELISTNELSEDYYKVASKVAVLNQSMNKGIKDLVDNWKDYKKTLTTAEKGTQDYADTALKTRKALASLVGVLDEDFIPKDFLDIPGVMDLIDQAVKGDIKSINELGLTMAKATVKAIKFEEGMKKSNGVKKTQAAGPTKDGSKLYVEEEDIVNFTKDVFEKQQGIVVNGIQSLLDSIENGTLKAGESITEVLGNTTKSWIDALNDMAYATGMSVDEMNSLLNELGVQADVTVKDKEVETSVPEYTTYEIENPTGDANVNDLNRSEKSGTWKATKKSLTVQTGTKKVKGSVSVAQINTGDKAGTPPTITYAGRDNVSSSALTPSSSSSNSGSSSSTPTTKAASHTHEVNRYSNEENIIKGLSNQYKRLNEIKDKAFGQSRIQAIEREIKKLKELKDASANYLDAIVGKGNASQVAQALYEGQNIGAMIQSGKLSGTIGADYRSLYSGADASGKQVEYTAKDSDGNEWLASQNYSLAGLNSLFGSNLNFILDSYGNVQNMDAILNTLQEMRNREADAYSRIADPSAESTTNYNMRVAYLDAIKERLEQYGKTVEDLTNQTDAYLEKISELQEKNAELISSKLEKGVNLNQKTIQQLNRAVKVLGDDIYKIPEAMGIYFDNNFKEASAADKQLAEEYGQRYEETLKGVELYQKNFLDSNAIAPEKAAGIFDELESGLDDMIDTAQEKMNQIKEYYGSVLDYWNEALTKVKQTIDQNITSLQHYQKLLTLFGKQADYDMLGDVLSGLYEEAQQDYNLKKAAYEEFENSYRSLVNEYGEYNNEEPVKTWLETAKNNMLEAKNEWLESGTSVAEALDAIFQNNIDRIFTNFENNLSGDWGNFDTLDKAMERQRKLDDEYLTKTNQIYEMNSLLHKLSQDIDKTDSAIAKRRLKSFSDEINALKSKEKLSKAELEIAKARYEVLQAEIALEEAQRAKTTVRLKRDNNGNYGYVYTADQDKINDAEQNLADKQNVLYNIGLKQAQEYSEKTISAYKEVEDAIKNLMEQRKQNLITEDEYNRSIQDIKEKYGELELSYLDSLMRANVILNQEGAEGQSEAWTNSFADIITNQRIFTDDSLGEADELVGGINQQLSWLDSQHKYFANDMGLNNKRLKQTVDDITNSTGRLIQKTVGSNGLTDAMADALSATRNLTNELAKQYRELKNDIQAYKDLADKINESYKKQLNLNSAMRDYHAAASVQQTFNAGNGGGDYSDGTSGNNGSNSSGNGGNKPSISHTHTMIPIKYFKRYGELWANYKCNKCDKTEEKRLGKWEAEGQNGGSYYVAYSPFYDTRKTKVVRLNYMPASGKTGMYTGSWNGPDIEENGKLAFLHQKELVLNADDTENVLSAVKLIRQISQTIDLQAAAQSAALQMSATPFSGNAQTLQQEVTIHAEFPNVQNHNEIEEAFNNLINRASQFANRS